MKGLYLLIILFSIWAVPLKSQNNFTNLIDKSGDAIAYPNAHVITIFDSTLVDVQETGLSFFYIHQLYKVLDLTGAKKLSVIKYPYEPQSAHLEIKEVKIYRKSGEIDVLTKSDIYDYPAPGSVILWGAREQMAEVGRLEVGDAVEVKMFKKGYTYALLAEDVNDDDRYIPPMRGHYYDIVPFWVHQPTLNLTYQCLVPKDKDLQFEVFHGELKSKMNPKEDKILYTFTKENVLPIKQEPNMLSLYDVATKLILTTAPDWPSKSRWFYGVNEDYGSFDYTDEIKDKVDEILIGAKNEMDSVSKLTHWVADEIRYFGLTMGEGEGFTLHKGEMTFRDRCGVCKDKAGMLITMLRAAGFESYAAMTMAGSKIDDIPADHFNHCVTAVKLSDGKLHMLDPTWVPFVRELWSSREQQQNYIVGTKEGEQLSEIPISEAENHYVKIVCDYEFSKRIYNFIGHLSLVAEGQADAAFRGALTRMYRSQWENYLLTELQNILPEYEISKLIFSDPYDYSQPFELSFNFSPIRRRVLLNGDKWMIPSIATKVAWGLRNYSKYIYTDLETREYPFRDAFSKQIIIQEKIDLFCMNDSLTIAFPKIENFDSDAASVEGSCVLNEKHEIVLNLNIKQKKRVYDADDWEDFKKALLVQENFANGFYIISLKRRK